MRGMVPDCAASLVLPRANRVQGNRHMLVGKQSVLHAALVRNGQDDIVDAIVEKAEASGCLQKLLSMKDEVRCSP